MPARLRKSGIEILGDIPWGSHFCQFYDSKEDLADILVPYFKTGLENNEYCLWIVSDPLGRKEAIQALRKKVHNLDHFLQTQQIEIFSDTEWFYRTGKLDPEDLLKSWFEKLDIALTKGYDGMRINGNEAWVRKEDWDSFMKYEIELNKRMDSLPIIALCAYPLSTTNGQIIFDVAHAHEAALSKRKGNWEILEEPEIKKMKAQLQKESEQLEQQVTERTTELATTVDKLQKEKELSQTIKESFPGIFKIIDENYRILAWNKMFEEITGYSAQEIAHLQTINDLHDISDREKALHLLKQGFATGKVSGDFKIRIKNGSVREIFFIGQQIEYDGKSCLIICGIDVTERNKAEEKLRQSENMLIEAEHLSHVGSWQLDLSTNKVKWSDELYEIYGVKRSEFDHTLETVIAFSHPDDKEFIIHVVEEAVATHKPYDFLYRIIRPDKEERILHVHGAVTTDEHGNVTKMYGAVQDVTERKKAEEKLRESESHLAEAQQLAHIGNWNLDLQKRTVTWSDELYRIFGLRPQERQIDRTILKSIHPDDRDRIEAIVQNSINTKEPYSFYYRIIRPDDSERIVFSRGEIISDDQGTALRVLGTTQDVTEQKRAEDKLRLAYQYLSYHVENTPLAVIEWDKDLNITKWSAQAEKIFGWKASEMLGKNMYDQSYAMVYVEDRTEVDKIAHELMHGLVERNFSLNRNYTKEGNVIYCEWYNSVLKDEQGNVITILSLIHDVTERKNGEEKLNKSYNQIRSLSEHLRTIREEERKYIAREIHDELGQYLTVLKMDVGLLNKKIHVEDEAVQTKLKGLTDTIDKIVYSVRRIASELRPSMLDDLGLTAAIAWHLREFEKQSGIKTIFTEPEDELDFLEPIKTHLFRIVQESLTNVVRHSKSSEVKIDLVLDEHELKMTIADNGIGFDEQKINFGKTFGILGMKERASIIAAQYNIKSEPGKGTKITVTVPYKQTKL